MTNHKAKSANIQALSATAVVSAIAVGVVAVLVFLGGGSATVKYAKDNISIFLGGTFAFFAVTFWLLFKAYTKLLEFFLKAGSIAAETVRNPTRTSEPIRLPAKTTTQINEKSAVEEQFIVLSPAFKLPFISVLLIVIISLAISAIYGGDPPYEWQKSLVEICTLSFKIGLGVLVGMVGGKAL